MSDLEAARILAALDRIGATLGRPVTVAALTASTNDDARRAAAAGAPHGALFLADAQTKGRGRGGHAWHSPPGENLYLSIVLRPRVSLAALPTLALVLGLCVARAVDEALEAEGMRAGIKWPNDVIVDGRKIAGLLVESSLRGGTLEAVVAGVGLNVRATAFPEEIADRATSLARLGARELDRALVAARVLGRLGEALPAFEASGLGSFLAELARRDVLRGVPIEVGEARGTGEGIDAGGLLQIRGEDGRLQAVAAGSVVAFGPLGQVRST